MMWKCTTQARVFTRTTKPPGTKRNTDANKKAEGESVERSDRCSHTYGNDAALKKKKQKMFVRYCGDSAKQMVQEMYQPNQGHVPLEGAVQNAERYLRDRACISLSCNGDVRKRSSMAQIAFRDYRVIFRSSLLRK